MLVGLHVPTKLRISVMGRNSQLPLPLATLVHLCASERERASFDFFFCTFCHFFQYFVGTFRYFVGINDMQNDILSVPTVSVPTVRHRHIPCHVCNHLATAPHADFRLSAIHRRYPTVDIGTDRRQPPTAGQCRTYFPFSFPFLFFLFLFFSFFFFLFLFFFFFFPFFFFFYRRRRDGTDGQDQWGGGGGVSTPPHTPPPPPP